MSDFENSDLVKRTSQEVPADFAKGSSGSLVTFGEGENLAWGIEISVPVNDDLRTFLGGRGVDLPQKISNVRFLSMTPEWSIPAEQRKIRTDLESKPPLSLIMDSVEDYRTLTNTGERPYEVLFREFAKVLCNDSDKQKFSKLLERLDGNEILIIQGHGIGSPLTIGEQYFDTPTDISGNQIQRTRNAVSVNEILDKYDKPNGISIILLESCNTENADVIARKKPIVYVHGVSSLASSTNNLARTVFSLPKQEVSP